MTVIRIHAPCGAQAALNFLSEQPQPTVFSCQAINALRYLVQRKVHRHEFTFMTVSGYTQG